MVSQADTQMKPRAMMHRVATQVPNPDMMSDVPDMVSDVANMVSGVTSMVATVMCRGGQDRTACDAHRQCQGADENQQTFHCRILPIQGFFEFGRLRSQTCLRPTEAGPSMASDRSARRNS